MEDDISEEQQKWNRVIKLYVVENITTIGAIERFIANQWSNVRKPNVLFHNDGYFIILMNTCEEKDGVIMNDPYTINNRPIIIRPWKEGVDFGEEIL